MKSAIITKIDFKSLKKGDRLEQFTIKKTNCGLVGKHPAHIVSCKRNGIEISEVIFHDGLNIRYQDEKYSPDNGIIVDSLNTESGSYINSTINIDSSLTSDINWFLEILRAINRLFKHV